MIMKKLGFIALILTGVVLFGCSESNSEEIIDQEQDATGETHSFEPTKEQLDIEQWMASVDNNGSLGIFSSLEYMSDELEIEVHAYKDTLDTNYVKIVEYTVPATSSSIQSRVFYLKDGKKVATRELLEEGEGDALHFLERVTYYDKDEKPLVSKVRTAEFEEQLEDVAFQVGKTYDCSMDRALRVLNQQGEFTPLFHSFINAGGDVYLVISDGAENGYTSTLLIQSFNGLIDKMYKNPSKYKGKQLSLAFTKEMSSDGNYQLLHGASLVK